MERFWKWIPAVGGALTLLLGTWAAVWPQQAVQLLPILLGLGVLALGACHVSACVREKSLAVAGPMGIPHAAQGAADLAVGIVLVANRSVSVTFLGAALGLWAVVCGVLSLRAAWQLRRDPYLRGSVGDGVVKIVVGVLMLLWPFGSMTLWTRLVGVLLMIAGASALVSALMFQHFFRDFPD